MARTPAWKPSPNWSCESFGGKLRTCFGTPMVWLRLSHLESRLGNFGEFIVIRLSRARLAQFIAALSAMVRALILTSGSAQTPSANEGPFHHRRHGRARRATGLRAASMKFTSTAKAVAALVTALALSTVGLAVTALPASAHTPTVSATCAGLTVDLKYYSVKTGNPTPNHVTVT